MSANIPIQITRDQRIANEIFQIAVMELAIYHVALRAAEHKKNGGDPWGYDNKINKMLEAMHTETRRIIGEPTNKYKTM